MSNPQSPSSPPLPTSSPTSPSSPSPSQTRTSPPPQSSSPLQQHQHNPQTPGSAPSSGGGTRSRSGTGTRSRGNSLRRASDAFMTSALSGIWTATGDALLTPENETSVHRSLTIATTSTTATAEDREKRGDNNEMLPVIPSQSSETTRPPIERRDSGSVRRGREPITPEQERLIQEWKDHFDRQDAKKGDTWWTKTVWGLKQFWKFFKTVKGAFITIWLLLVIAWGGMIFLLLCNASPAMISKYGKDDDRSARKKWMEVDTQVLNVLFCITGFGLFPWRARDTWLLYKWRVKKDIKGGMEVLAGIHRGWFRADDMGPRLPLKLKEAEKEQKKKDEKLSKEVADVEEGFPNGRPDAADEILNISEPLGEKTTDTSEFRYATRSGDVAGATKPVWLLDAVVWFNLWNSLWQACLAGCVWGMNRFQRPAWTTTLFIILSFGCGIASGYVIWKEGRRIGKIEGRTVPVPLRVSGKDREVGTE